MKLRFGHLLIALLITLVAAPAYAAIYDASGHWLIETTPDQEIKVPFVGDVDVPDAWLWATIEQPDGENVFKMVTDEITDLGNVSFSGGGEVVGAQYNFNPPLAEKLNLGTIEGYEILDGIWADISLVSFELTADDKLKGRFDLGRFGTVSFTGTKEAVPVPAAVWLLGSGMVALVGFKKREKV